jgi:hypothetical protein
MSDTIEAGKPAYIDADQYIATVIRKEKDAKRPGYGREAWSSAALLWGDCVFVRSITGGMAEVSAKGHRLEVPVDKLTTKGILSLWQIDCGQGDAALLRFPDDKWWTSAHPGVAPSAPTAGAPPSISSSGSHSRTTTGVSRATRPRIHSTWTGW